VVTVSEGLDKLSQWCGRHAPEYAVILGSGITFPRGSGVDVDEIPFDALPGLSRPSVKGHRGVLKLVRLNGRAGLIFSGRRHLYEGCSIAEVTAPVALISKLRIPGLLITNAAGALNPVARAGDIVLLEDFIIPFDIGIENGPDYEKPSRDSADKGMLKEIRKAARIEEIKLKTGTYVFMPGPAFETPAEIKMLRMFGADVVGMSTAPEWWAALSEGIAVCGLSLVTNVHRPGGSHPSHRDVLAAAELAGEKLNRVLHRTLFGVGA
jgi:purine-nucleoside phosphorylase